MKKIMLIDDILVYGNNLREQLEALGYDVYYSPTAEGIMGFIRKFQPDLLFLDVELNESKNGIQVCKEVSYAYPNLPIIIISSHSDTDTKIQGVSAGALSYVEKPLTARLLSVYIERHSTSKPQKENSAKEIDIDFKEQLIYFSDGSIATISPIQNMILKVLCDNPGRNVTLEQLESAVWGNNRPANATAIIYNNISGIRRLLRPTCRTFLRSIRGAGYTLLLGDAE